MNRRATTRRSFLGKVGAASAATLGAEVFSTRHSQASEDTEALATKGKAKHCILIWLGGGACQVDTWDPKRLGDPKTRKPGSAYEAIDTAVEGTQVCRHLSECAKILDRFNIVRTVTTKDFPTTRQRPISFTPAVEQAAQSFILRLVQLRRISLRN